MPKKVSENFGYVSPVDGKKGRNAKMKENFDKVLDYTLYIEGGYIDDLSDPGGETKFGISKRAYPALDIKNLSLSTAKEIYRKDYWNAVQGDALPFPVDMCVFDCAVNMGIKTALDLYENNKDYRAYQLARIEKYIEITRKNFNLAKFFRGWVIRTIKLTRLCEVDNEKVPQFGTTITRSNV